MASPAEAQPTNRAGPNSYLQGNGECHWCSPTPWAPEALGGNWRQSWAFIGFLISPVGGGVKGQPSSHTPPGGLLGVALVSVRGLGSPYSPQP